MSEFDPGESPGEPVAPAWRWQEMVLALGALAALLVAVIVLRDHIENFVRTERPAVIDTSRGMQERRGRMLADLARGGFVTEVDSVGESPQVYLAPAFFALSIDGRLACLDSLYEVFYPGQRSQAAMLLVYDAHNRRLIGSYSPPHGFLLEQ